MQNIFNANVANEVIARINQLTPTTQRQWGKMSVDQMLAHCNISYELMYEPAKHPQAKGFMKLMLRYMVKPFVTNEKPYKQNLQTAPFFIIKDERKFEDEKKRLIDHIQKTQALGEQHFHNTKSHSFGVLTGQQWNNMMYKHLDHHLTQFGA